MYVKYIYIYIYIYIIYIYIYIIYVNNIVVHCPTFFSGKGSLDHEFSFRLASTEASANPEGNIPRLCSTLAEVTRESR